jgi:hypothetical protein
VGSHVDFFSVNGLKEGWRVPMWFEDGKVFWCL